MLLALHRNGVAPPSRYIYIYIYIYDKIYLVAQVLPELRTRGVALRGDRWEYKQLLGTYTCKSTDPFLLLHYLEG